MNTPIVGRIYHVVDKTTGIVVKVGSTIKSLSWRWSLYNKKKYNNHFLREVKIIASSDFDWYQPKDSYCPFLWHLVAAEHCEMLDQKTFQSSYLSNQISPLDQKFMGFNPCLAGSVASIMSGLKSKDEKSGFFAPGMNVKGGKIWGPIQGAKNASVPGRMSEMGKKGGKRSSDLKVGMFAPENLGKGGRTNARSGHLARIASSGGKVGGKKSVANMNHKYWHVRRGIKNPKCYLCRSIDELVS